MVGGGANAQGDWKTDVLVRAERALLGANDRVWAKTTPCQIFTKIRNEADPFGPKVCTVYGTRSL